MPADLEIDKETLLKTTKCSKDFACLTSCSSCCKVEYTVSNEIIFIKCLNDSFCNYQMPFGAGRICNCPTRKAIYNQYKV